MLLLN